jgi:diphosphomevalonate decarboxylase
MQAAVRRSYYNPAMPTKVTARAHSNIALCKYWGKLELPRLAGEPWLAWRLRKINCPATSSISLTLDALTSETTVTLLGPDAQQDSAVLDGREADGRTQSLLSGYISLWRAAGLLSGYVHVESHNNFPTAAGLASSASGYAALAAALSGFAPEPLSQQELSRWARRGSGSAARSIHGGVVALPVGSDAAASLAVSAAQTPLAMAVCIVEAPPKDVSSRDGMSRSAATSPYYEAWLGQALADYDSMIETLWTAAQSPDSTTDPDKLLWELGAVTERNCMAMHAVMQTTVPSLLYWAPGTLAVMHAVRHWRDDGGPPAYFTIDAGPHVELLCLQTDLDEVVRLAGQLPGVQRVVPCLPGGPAEIVANE